MKKNKIKLTLDAISQNEAFARGVISLFAARADPAVDAAAELRTAVSEAVTNCVVHAYKNEPDDSKKQIYITAWFADEHTVCVKIKDRGCGIADIKQAKIPLFTTDASGERGGMGFAVMESFCDKFSVISKVGRGTAVTLTKRLLND